MIPALRPWLAVCLLAAGRLPSASAATTRAERDEAKALTAEVNRCFHAGNLREAERSNMQLVALDQRALGPEDSVTVANLYGGAIIDYMLGEYQKAEPIFQRVLAIREKTLGPNHPDTVKVLSSMAIYYDQTGDSAKAEVFFQRALAIQENAHGIKPADLALTMENLALHYAKTNRPDKAMALGTRALAIMEKALGPEHPDLAGHLKILANVYDTVGDYPKAEQLYQRALAITEKARGPDDSGVADCLLSLGDLARKTGDYPKAEPLYQRALAIREKALGAGHPDTAVCLARQALLYDDMGAYLRAEPLFRRALAITEKARGPNDESVAPVLNNLAFLLYEMGDSAKALPLYERALAILQKDEGLANLASANVLNNLGLLYQALGDYAKAQGLLEQALAIREKAQGPDHPDTATCYNNLAFLAATMGDRAKAEGFYEHALAITKKTLGPTHPKVATTLNNMALLEDNNGDYAKAEGLYLQSAAIEEKVEGPVHPGTANSLGNLAEFYEFRRKDPAKAEPLMRRALAIDEKTLGPENPRTAVQLSNLAFVCADLGKTGEALELAVRATKAEESQLANILSFTSEQQRLAFEQTTRPFDLIASLGSARDIAQTILRQKGVVLDSLLEDRRVAEAGRNEKARGALDQLQAAKQRLAQLTLEVPKDLSAAARQRRETERQARADEIERIETSLAQEVAGLGRARRALGVTIEQVQGALAGDQALVELVRYIYSLKGTKPEARYGAVVLTATGDPVWAPLGPAAEIDRNIALYAKSVRGKTDATTLEATLHALHDEVWAPVETALPPGAGTIILSPDDQLNFVSFATLLTPGNQFLAEKYSIRYLASGRDLLLTPGPAGGPLMAVFGNPEFSAKAKPATSGAPEDNTQLVARGAEAQDFASMHLPPLAGTARECTELQTLAGTSGTPSQLFLGADATERHLREVKSPRILHLATHGFFLPKPAGGAAADPMMKPAGDAVADRARRLFLGNPMRRSGLALAGAQETFASWAQGIAPPGDDDGVVTAEEVGGLKLQGTWLVALSACDTGAGESEAGEGVLGLRRGFIQAGAQNLLMTLWPISDEATVQLMLDFYARALRDGNAPRALADTQREWLVKLRGQRGLLDAVNLAGAFIINSQGRQ